MSDRAPAAPPAAPSAAPQAASAGRQSHPTRGGHRHIPSFLYEGAGFLRYYGDEYLLYRPLTDDVRPPSPVAVDTEPTSAAKLLSMIDAIASRSRIKCPLCRDVVQRAQRSTACHHSFCADCIAASLARSPVCPICEVALAGVVPDVQSDAKVEHHRRLVRVLQLLAQTEEPNAPNGPQSTHPFTKEILECTLAGRNVGGERLRMMLHSLESREPQDTAWQTNRMLCDLLEALIEQRTVAERQIRAELHVLRFDLAYMRRKSLRNAAQKQSPSSTAHYEQRSQAMLRDLDEFGAVYLKMRAPYVMEKLELIQAKAGKRTPAAKAPDNPAPNDEPHQDADERDADELMLNADSLPAAEPEPVADIPVRAELMDITETMAVAKQPSAVRRIGLPEFRKELSVFAQYGQLKRLSRFRVTEQSLVSSMAFDRDNEYFAICSTNQYLKIYLYATVAAAQRDYHCATYSTAFPSRLACLAYSPLTKSTLAMGDYDGGLVLWDVDQRKALATCYEHRKRCCAVAFNALDPKLLATCSEDGCVKLWTTGGRHSVSTITMTAPVTALAFRPSSSCHLALGSGDASVSLYDLRNTSAPLSVFLGHRKQIAHVAFAGRRLLSASCESLVKMWDTEKHICERTFRGHRNLTHYVGLASDGQHFACGSEGADRSLYVYSTLVSRPVLSADADPFTGDQSAPEHYTSSVCWRPGTNVLMSANSRGILSIYRLC